MSNSQARVEEVFAEAARLFASKNAHYGDSWREQGWRGNLSRILEKSKRLRQMLWRGGNVLLNGSSEHPRETALDMINTLAFMIVNMDDNIEWGNEPGARVIEAPVRAEAPGSYEEALRKQAYDELPPNGMVVGYDSNLQEISVHPENANEVTRTDIPIPGEDTPVAKPSPRKRPGARVTDKGSGPRPVQDRPQA